MGFIFIGAIALFAQLLSAKDVTSDERSRVTAFIPYGLLTLCSGYCTSSGSP